MGVEFALLGDVRVQVDGRDLDIGHARQRCVLAVLLIEAGRTVTTDQLVDRVWGERAPVRARHAFYSYISRLRTALRDVAGFDIARRGGAYVLHVDAGTVDLHLFRSLLGQAREATEERRALALYDRALRLWRGVPFEELDSPWLASVRDRLLAERFTAEVQRYDVALDLGMHDELLAELATATAANPFDERIAGQHVLALYRCGRRTEALTQYREFRARLVDDTGVEPGDQLQRLHQQMLASDVPRIPSARREDEAPGPVPRQLPAASPWFVSRTRELDLLDDARDAAAGVVVVTGAGGSGKTSLALHWGHREAGTFPDGQLYVDLRGFDRVGRPLRPADALQGLLETLGVPPEQIPTDVDARAALYRSLLARRRVLVVLDNAYDAEQVRPLLPGDVNCLAVVTSRDRLSCLVAREGAVPVLLTVLDESEAVSLLARRVGPDRVAAEPDAVAQLVAHSARLPLALAVIAGRAVGNPTFPLSALAGELRDERARLDVLESDGTTSGVRAVLSSSYRTLSPDAARLFRLLGLHPGPDADLFAAASLAGVEASRGRALLGELARTHLVDEHRPGRFRSHDLLRAYAAELAESEDSAHDRRTALLRCLDFYLHTGFAAERHLAPHWPPITLTAAQEHVAQLPVTDYDRAVEWFTAEHDTLLAATAEAARARLDVHAWQLPWVLSTYLSRRGHWAYRAETQRTALAAADRLDNDVARATSHHLLGRAEILLGNQDEALEHLRRALDLSARVHDTTGMAVAHFSLSSAYDLRQRNTTALVHARKALRLCREAGNRVWEAFILTAIGWYHGKADQHAEALAHCAEAKLLLDRIGDRDGRAHNLHCLGRAHHGLGQYTEAARCYRDALALFRELGSPYLEAKSLDHLGDALQAAGDQPGACRAWTRALEVLEPLAHPDAAEIESKLLDTGVSR
ncbi:DNA-binding SARP family transcriptional activator/Flp pilus assembly protein TadD [Saccharothrix ecbatanensis]|uniref:DNA-binding SARP family transcriptional activator/Flp pilus assembly protein TadD n=1 Tax=Saccharothrix ecbatanensis TaxID=1105145 RepID=A0A7W9HIY9_9PSEU|nr:AfsR/SARP family transcriptional regulator [Saccharothrix ecbatanensis]MBB5803164.1 DNA-binding SARP family transcriptional activator/Flp pilus assembly protein TadD [Saccharothrix ecbatanensis]